MAGKPKKLSYKDFLKSFNYAPRVAVELLIENKEGELLLIKREDKPYVGYLHVPGGFILKNERIEDCIYRVLKKETGISKNLKYKFVGFFETIKKDRRGHLLHYVVKMKSDNSKQGDYYPKLPKNTVPYQVVFLSRLGYKKHTMT